jgi:hypothetical protein
MGHGQYLVYSSKSSLFEECILVFQLLVYKRILLSLLTEILAVAHIPSGNLQ